MEAIEKTLTAPQVKQLDEVVIFYKYIISEMH